MKGIICPKIHMLFKVKFKSNDRIFFLRNKIEGNVAEHLIYGCDANKNHKGTSFGMGVISKMNIKYKIWLNLALNRVTSYIFLESLITSRSFKIISFFEV